MFYENSNESNQKQEQPMSDQQFFVGMGMLVVGALGFWVSENQRVIDEFHFKNFETIYIAAWVALLIPVFFIIRTICKKTRKMKERAQRLESRWEKSGPNILVGRTDDGVKLHLTEKDRCSHVQIIGSTGRGKTQSVIVPWAFRDLCNKRSTLIIDGKGSSDIPSQMIRGATKETNLEKPCAMHFDLDDEKSIRINPLAGGSSQQITDRIFKSFEFEDPYYKNVQYDICGYLIRLIHSLEEEVTFKRLYELLLDDNKLSEAISLCKNELVRKKLKLFLKEPKRDRGEKLSGLMSQLSPFAEGEIAPLVNGDDGSGRGYLPISTFLIDGGVKSGEHTRQGVFIVSIPTLKYQEIGARLGKLILQEVAYAASIREKMDHVEFTSLFLDEFSEFVYEGFISLLNKARSSKIGIHLSHQSLGDLSVVSDDFARSVNTNTNVKCILGLNDPETADFFARHMGTETGEKRTEQAETGSWGAIDRTGAMSIREVDSYKVHPNALKSFAAGQGVLHLPTENGNITEVLRFEMFYGDEITWRRS